MLQNKTQITTLRKARFITNEMGMNNMLENFCVTILHKRNTQKTETDEQPEREQLEIAKTSARNNSRGHGQKQE